MTERPLCFAQFTMLTLCQLQQLAHVTGHITMLKRGISL